uniref:hypothetical protein n=1 Tax=Brucella pseudintermedia TaxID=370111 RepID=UPI00158D7F01|nr:hypothetical protein [Brucella pseudintermedia]
MTTLPEEAVTSADIIQVITDLRLAILQDDDEGLAEHAEPMIKAKELISKLSALPHLPQGEPSAARELALEEAARVCDAKIVSMQAHYDQTDNPFIRSNLAGDIALISHLAAAIRALSSPDHIADAGKVEGDGWPTGEYEVDYEVICNGEWVAGSTDLNDAKHYAAVYSQDGKIEIVEARTYRRTLPSALSEGAE